MALSTEMTPRAWRMIAYSCIGALIYGLILLMELLQNLQLNRIDAQLRSLDKQVAGVEEPYSAAASTIPLNPGPASPPH